MKFSSKVQKCGLSPMRKFHPYAVAARAAGKKIYHLNIGQPDIPTPEACFDAVRNFNYPVLEYAPSPGIPELIDAVRGYYDKIGISLTERDVLVTTGGSEALQIVCNCILDDGDEIIIPEPFYPNYNTFVCTTGGTIRPLTTTPEEGYFYADRENFRDVQEATGTMGKRHPLSFLLEAADDISYRTADIEDGVKKGCLSYETLLRELGEYKREEQGEAYRRVVSWMEDKYRRALEKEYGRPDLYAVQNWIVSVQGQLLGSATDSFAAHYEAIMAGEYGADLLTGTEMGLLAKALGSIAFRHVFQERPILQLEIGAQRIFEFLLERFVDAVIPYDTELPMTQVQEKLVALISENYRRIYKICSQGKDEAEKLYLRLLLVTDYICGMTDSYARDMYQELNGIYIIR